jgi:nicotinate-nucleotide--dimethylbenzimidazole phosphoribosyltransferase
MALLDETRRRIAPLDATAMAQARARQDTLTKPRGALGRLEDLSVQLAGITGQARPRLARKTVVVMAADHGVAAAGVSAYPAEVTRQMVLNFLRGGAAINVLARQMGARVAVVDMGVREPLPTHPDLRVVRLGPGTRNMLDEPAMSAAQACAAVEAGIRIAAEEVDQGCDLLATGDMGIGNTTASAAIIAVLAGAPPRQVAGRGTGLDEAQLQHKIGVIERALARHRPDPADPLDVLAKVGGFEIGGLAGLILGAATRRVPVVLDGFIAGAAALVAVGLCPAVRPYLIASHRSAELGHAVALQALGLRPLFDLDLRLGEGTGAVLAFPIVEAAARLLDEMATFAEAGVSDRDAPAETA